MRGDKSGGLRLLQPDEYAAWDRFVEAHPSGCLYHTTAWKLALDEGCAPARYQITVVYRDGEIVAGCCYLHKRKWGVVPVASHPLLTQYCGFLIGAAALEEDVLNLCVAMKRKYIRQRFACAPGIDLELNCGYQQNKKCTLILDLAPSLEEIRAGIDPAMRRQIRKAERLSPSLEMNADSHKIKDLLTLTLTRNVRNAAVPGALVDALISHPALEKSRHILTASLDGLPVSVIMYFIYKDVAYYSIAATDPEKLGTGISPWLVDKFIEQCHGAGVREIDFLGGNLPSVAQFKRKFGAVERLYVEVLSRWDNSFDVNDRRCK